MIRSVFSMIMEGELRSVGKGRSKGGGRRGEEQGIIFSCKGHVSVHATARFPYISLYCEKSCRDG